MEDVCEYLITKDPSFVAMLISYQTEAAPFAPSFFLDASISMNPTRWWKAVEKCGVPHDFTELAFQLLSAPASSASIKRIFSIFGWIHIKIRNCLGNEKTAKLVFCHRLFRGLCDSYIWNGWIQLYTYERCESLLSLLNKRYLQIITVLKKI